MSAAGRSPLFSASFLLLFLILLIIAIPQSSTTAAVSINYQLLSAYCPINGTASIYASNSTYKVNLDNLLTTIVNAALTEGNGFNYGNVGITPDQVYGLAQCRGNETIAVCRGCLKTAAQDIVQNCSGGRSAVAWYEECFLRYSENGFYSPSITDINSWNVSLYNINDAPSPQAYNRSVVTLLDGLAHSAAYDSSEKFAYGSRSFSNSLTIYGLVQCTRDLSDDTCFSCVKTFNVQIMKVFGIKIGARLFGLNCYIRYEDYDFAISDDVPPPSSSPRSPAPSSSPTNITDPPHPNPGEKSDATKRALVIAIPVVAALFLILLAIVFCIRRRKQTKEGFIRADRDQEIDGVECLLFSLDVLRHATDHFSDAYKLGEGGFGPVYKGILQDGEQIAIKRLSRSSGQGLLELKNEVDLVVKLQHRNLVRLLGCCLEGEEMLLVYEYLPNTSLDKIIFDPTRKVELDWAKRYKIIEGISRGLLYLHEDSRLKIVHRDLKLSNILLDKDMNPKIADFGLAKLFSLEETERNTHRIVGTYGYMAPEYAMHGFFSTKSDVFSYGVMILEIVTGRKNSSYQGNSGTNLLGYVWQQWTRGATSELIDETLMDACHPQEVMRCICIGLLCVQEDPAGRPNMETIVFMLKNHSVNIPTPSAPAFFIHNRSSSEMEFLSRDSHLNSHRRQSSKGSRSISLGVSSNNDVSMSVVEPR